MQQQKVNANQQYDASDADAPVEDKQSSQEKKHENANNDAGKRYLANCFEGRRGCRTNKWEDGFKQLAGILEGLYGHIDVRFLLLKNLVKNRVF